VNNSIINYTPPNSIEAEESVIGSIFLEPNVLDEIIEEIRWDDFYYENNRMIFKTIETLSEKGEPVDVVSVIERLRILGLWKKSAGK